MIRRMLHWRSEFYLWRATFKTDVFAGWVAVGNISWERLFNLRILLVTVLLFSCGFYQTHCLAIVPVGTFDREFSNFIGLEESEASVLVAARGLSPSSRLLFQAIETIDRKPFRDWHQIQGAVRAYDAAAWNGLSPNAINLQEDVFKVQGYLESVRIHVTDEPTMEGLLVRDAGVDLPENPKKGQASNEDSSNGVQRIEGFVNPTFTLYECVLVLTEASAGSVNAVSIPSQSQRFRIFTSHIPDLFLGLDFKSGEDGVRAWYSPEIRTSGIRTPQVGSAESVSAESVSTGSRLNVFATVLGIGTKGVAKVIDFETQSPTDPLPTGLTKRLGWAGGNPLALEALVQGSRFIDRQEAGDSSRNLGQLVQSWQTLSASGFDLGLLDSLALSQRRELVPADNEGFYQMLSAVGKAPAGLGFDQELPIRQSILNPNKQVGQGFHVFGVVKQITRVQNEAGERGEQLGVSQYYLLHLLVPLKKPIRLNFSKDRKITYQKHFPVVIACRQLPAGLQAGESMRQWISCDAFFFKLWSYQSSRTKDSALDQWSPLLVGFEPKLQSPPGGQQASWPIGWLLLFPVALATIGLLVAGLGSYKRRPRFRSKNR